ncbi:MAG: hypothetical protein AB9897_01110 [Anaerolineaceae bacterium]
MSDQLCLDFEKEIIAYCEICGAPLDCDNVYGPEGFDLCRYHHEKFYQLVEFMVTGKVERKANGQAC